MAEPKGKRSRRGSVAKEKRREMMLFSDLRGRKGRGKRMLVREGRDKEEGGGEKRRILAVIKEEKGREKDNGVSDLSGGKKRDE